MGEVYLAMAAGPEGVEKPVAIKLIRDLHQQNQALVDMFLEEAKVAFLLSHPNVVQTHEIGRVEGQCFIVMEYVDGITLERLLRYFTHQLEQPLPVPFALFIGLQVARGLDYAHGMKDQEGRPLSIVHRDVSPSNVLLSRDGQVKITDFGLAKSTLRKVESMAGHIKGKAAYMPPEQLAGAAIDARADLYALGVVLYEMLGGRNPFGDPATLSLQERVASQVLPLQLLAPHLSRQAVAVVERCMATDPADRLPGARDLVRAIDACMREADLRVSDYELAEFVVKALAESEASSGRPHPFDLALGLQIDRIAGNGGLSTFVKVSTLPTSRREPLVHPGNATKTPAPPEGGFPVPLSAATSSVLRRSWPLLRWAVTLALALVLGGAGLLLFHHRRGTKNEGSIPVTLASKAADDASASPAKPRAGGLDGSAAARASTSDAKISSPPRPSSRLSHHRPPKGKATGTLSVNSEPWSTVFVDGERVRETPLVGHRLTVGRHRVRLVNPVRKLETTRVVTVTRDTETRLSLELGK